MVNHQYNFFDSPKTKEIKENFIHRISYIMHIKYQCPYGVVANLLDGDTVTSSNSSCAIMVTFWNNIKSMNPPSHHHPVMV